MPTLATSKEIPRGEYVIGKNTIRESGIIQFHTLMQCTPELAYALFGQAKLKQLRLEGEEGFIVVNPKDLASGYWGMTGKTEPEEDKEWDYDV